MRLGNTTGDDHGKENWKRVGESGSEQNRKREERIR
jgi:hypothetical protein